MHPNALQYNERAKALAQALRDQMPEVEWAAILFGAGYHEADQVEVPSSYCIIASMGHPKKLGQVLTKHVTIADSQLRKLREAAPMFLAAEAKAGFEQYLRDVE